MVTQLRVERRAFPSAGGGAWDGGSYTVTSEEGLVWTQSCHNYSFQCLHSLNNYVQSWLCAVLDGYVIG